MANTYSHTAQKSIRPPGARALRVTDGPPSTPNGRQLLAGVSGASRRALEHATKRVKRAEKAQRRVMKRNVQAIRRLDRAWRGPQYRGFDWIDLRLALFPRVHFAARRGQARVERARTRYQRVLNQLGRRSA